MDTIGGNTQWDCECFGRGRKVESGGFTDFESVIGRLGEVRGKVVEWDWSVVSLLVG